MSVAQRFAMRGQILAWKIRAQVLGGNCPVCSAPGAKRRGYGRLFLQCQASDCGFVWCHDSSESVANDGMGLVGSWGGVERGGERDDYMVRFLNGAGKPRRRVLIFGAGTTLVFRVLHDEGFEVEGADVDAEVVNYRSAEFPGQFRHAFELERRRGEFDIITACEVFEHLHNPNRWLDILAANLAPDGVLCGSTNFYPGSGPIEDGQDPGYMSYTGHVSYWSESALSKCVGRLGFKVVLFEMVCPGSVKPDLTYGSLFPNKRMFFASRDLELIAALDALKARNPILQCDTSDYPVRAYRVAPLPEIGPH